MATSPYHGHILHNRHFELVCIGSKAVAEVCRFAVRANASADGEAVLQEVLHDPRGYETIRSSYKDLALRDCRHDGQKSKSGCIVGFYGGLWVYMKF